MAVSKNTKPTVLLATTSSYYPAARLVMALAGAGCTVDAVCPAGHPLRVTSAVRYAYDYRGLWPLRSFARAIAAAKPDLVIPGDDLATEHLHALHGREQRNGNAGSALCALIERSLGSAQSFSIVSERGAFMELAQREGVRVPVTKVLKNLDDLRGSIAGVGFPAVLKANGTSGGDGVKIGRTLADAGSAFEKLEAPPPLARALKRALFDRDQTLLRSSILRRRHTVNLQAFVAGREATSTVFCWQGETLASLHFEVVNKASAAGHATVMRLIEHEEMSAAVERLVSRLGLSGFYGFDFMLASETGHAYLI